MQPHRYWVEENNHVSRHAGHTLPHAAQDAVSFLCYKGALLAHVQIKWDKTGMGNRSFIIPSLDLEMHCSSQVNACTVSSLWKGKIPWVYFRWLFLESLNFIVWLLEYPSHRRWKRKWDLRAHSGTSPARPPVASTARATFGHTGDKIKVSLRVSHLDPIFRHLRVCQILRS